MKEFLEIGLIVLQVLAFVVAIYGFFKEIFKS